MEKSEKIEMYPRAKMLEIIDAMDTTIERMKTTLEHLSFDRPVTDGSILEKDDITEANLALKIMEKLPSLIIKRNEMVDVANGDVGGTGKAHREPSLSEINIENFLG